MVAIKRGMGDRSAKGFLAICQLAAKPTLPPNCKQATLCPALLLLEFDLCPAMLVPESYLCPGNWPVQELPLLIPEPPFLELGSTCVPPIYHFIGP